MIAFGFGLSTSTNLGYELGSQSAIDGGAIPPFDGYAQWVDNEGNPMRDNLGNILYFNTNEAA